MVYGLRDQVSSKACIKFSGSLAKKTTYYAEREDMLIVRMHLTMIATMVNRTAEKVMKARLY